MKAQQQEIQQGNYYKYTIQKKNYTKRKQISDCYIAYKITHSQYSKGGEVKSLAEVQFVTVTFAREAVALAKVAVPLARAALLFTQVVSGMRPAKHLSVFHQLPQDFQGTSLAIDKKR